MCFDLARDHLDADGRGEGTQIEGWVNTFADNACVDWTIEKRDKLRLQGFLSAAWKKKPDLHFTQLFEITRQWLVPLTGVAFDDVRTFLQDVAAL